MRTLAIASLLLSLAACNAPQNPDQIRERTANATATVKQDTKAVAEGIKEGLHKDTGKTVNLNAASKEDLLTLPGVTDARAERIIAARPYRHADELVSKKVLTQGEYDRISSRVTANQ